MAKISFFTTGSLFLNRLLLTVHQATDSDFHDFQFLGSYDRIHLGGILIR